MTIVTDLESRAPKMVTNMDRINQFVNTFGPVDTDVGPQKSIPQLAAEAKIQVDKAQLAADTALAASHYYGSRAAGEAATATDGLFSTDDGAGNLIYYRKTSDGSVEIARAITPVSLSAPSGAGIVGVNLGTGTVYATVADALYGAVHADLSTYGVGDGVAGSFGDVAVHAAVQNGARVIHWPAGQFKTYGEVKCVAPDGNGLTVIGEGASTVVTTTTASHGFDLDGLRPSVQRLHVHVGVTSYGGIATVKSSGKITDALVADVLVTMEQSLTCNAFTVSCSGGAEIDGFMVVRCRANQPRRIGLEFLNQGGSERKLFRRLVVDQFSCYQPYWAAQPTYAPAISMDGLIVNPKVDLYAEDTPGSAIELIEVYDPEVGGTLVRPVGDLVAITNDRTVNRPKIIGLRVYQPIGETRIFLGSAADAELIDCNLFGTHIDNGNAPRTRLNNMRMTSANPYMILNAGGPEMQIKGGSLDHRPYTGSGGAIFNSNPGSSTTLTGTDLFKSAGGTYFYAPGVQPACGGYFKDGVFVPSGV